MELQIRPLNRTLDVTPGVNLLAALREAEVPVSYSCMAGRCGTCRCLLTGEDGRRSEVLACQTWLTRPAIVEITEPDEVVVHPARSLSAKVVAVQALGPDVHRLLLAPTRPLAHSPGQYVQLQFKPGLVRPYSMAGLATDALLEFHVREVTDGRASGHVANGLQVGDAVRVSGPLGTAYLRQQHRGPMLCVASGTGLAPILSIVRGALDAGMANPIHLYLGGRTPRELYGLDQLEALQQRHAGLRVTLVVGSGADPARHRQGRVAQAIERDLGELTGWRAYLCGSPSMVEATAMAVRRLGVAAGHVHADAFYLQAD